MDFDADVLVVGGGPTGLALANALGIRGVETILVEREEGVAGLPRAVSVDDESMRFIQDLDLLEESRDVVLPGTGTKYFGRRNRLLGYSRGPAYPPFGHPVKNPIDHAQFQQLLLDGLERFDCVDVRHLTRFVDVEQEPDAVVATIEGPAGGVKPLRVRHLVGCDGGRSTVRANLGVQMNGNSFGERWLVVDTIHDQHDERYAMHHGDPERPHVIIVGREGRCRYEFLLADDEAPDGDELFELAARFVGKYRNLERADVVRSMVYTFNALVAERWLVGRTVLAGDSAHMMPPFAGQGMNSGLRDAVNLGWKLAAVSSGLCSAELLETYESERRRHVEAMVQLSVKMGQLMMTKNRFRAQARDVAFALGARTPAFGRFVGKLGFKPTPRYFAGAFASLAGNSDDVVGSMLRQPRVLTATGIVPFDQALGRGFALLGVDLSEEELMPIDNDVWSQLAAKKVLLRLGDRLPTASSRYTSVADADGELTGQLGPYSGSLVLVRPDRFIAGAFARSDEGAFAGEITEALSLRSASRRQPV